MRNVEISYITDKEAEDFRRSYNSEVAGGAKPEQSLDDMLISIKNQTLVVMRQVKNVIEWKDIEKMVKFVRVLEKCEKGKDTFELEEDEYKTALEVFKDAVATGKISGYGLEKFVGVYKDLEGAK